MSDPAKLHSLGLKLAEARREVIRSRTVIRIIRSAYRMDEFNTSTETIPARFLMLVVGSMICDCAAIFYDNNNQRNFKIIESVGCSKLSEQDSVTIEIVDNSLTLNKNDADYVESDITRFMDAEKILFVSDTKTGYAIAIGFHYNSTIDHQFDLNDQETMRDTLAVYTDILERRRTRRLLEQSTQNAEAREAEVNDLVSNTTKRMLSIVNVLEKEVSYLSKYVQISCNNSKDNVINIANLFIELKDVINVTSEITEKHSFSMIIEKEWVLLSEFLTAVVRNTQQICIQQGVDVRLRPLRTRMYVWLDRILMEMILNTLVSEALADISGEGELFIEVGHHEGKTFSILIQGHNRARVTESAKNENNSGMVKGNQVSASIRRLIEAHNANLTIERPEPGLISIYLYINESECEVR